MPNRTFIHVLDTVSDVRLAMDLFHDLLSWASVLTLGTLLSEQTYHHYL